MSATPSLYIGLMSGTSLDGVDGVLADFAGGGIRSIAAAFTPFPAELRSELMALQAASHNELEREALAANGLALCYAECVRQLMPSAGVPVTAVAVHGQTIRHRPELGFTRQTNNPALLAELTGIDVIADFRSRDIAAGGQGAPLVPAFHEAAFGKPDSARVVVNIGGIGNISVLHGDGRVTGFDTGPGNVLMDLWIGRHLGKPYDEDGAWAAGGRVHEPLLEALLDEAYFRQPAPKSTGRDLFHDQWLNAKLARFGDVAPQDVMATLTRLTAVTIAESIRGESAGVEAVYACGGGAYNATLLQEIGNALGGVQVESTEALGVAPNRVEALAFAWLGYRFSQREPGNLPAVTGARGARILGALYPA
ncbi:anhydro-N-acetylmuramic acid kinase [Telluria aromaticivorans]|uniref:Anhydro-N-acetylmuramic acid kinase n=1 Tax=Telluria aromaticivorans TaxID=2725995 RepID=A0A7Y2K0W6_9BURK|nr:anhydro-N-acetylmuramic acid kinase [Telluria aromaticivorans]NNG24616.1 anhydro-N-acetylmuramic acid kinase [Telluria aromaticivorans]